MDNTQELRTLSLCTGYGGIERGLELAGEQLDVLAHVEIEAFAIANLVAKMEQGKLGASPIWTNLKTLPVEPFRDRVDLLTGGYPCQPFSSAGKRAGKDDPRHLWPYIADIIESVRPTQCFFENVEGHISLGLREVLGSLEDLGYSATWGIFSATEVGAPHQRKRVYILANSVCTGVWNHSSTLADQRRGKAAVRPETLRQGYRAKLPVRVDSAGADSGTEVAHANTHNGPRGSQQEREYHGAKEPLRDSQGGLGSLVADSTRLQRNGFSNNSRELLGTGEVSELGDCGGAENVADSPGEQGEVSIASWSPEPRVGRVVDGCPNRVDRIRLLGNGVVPQTAAKAWLTLNEESLI